MKNFDFITKLAEVIPSFSQLHAYCDKAEIFQKTFPEESASNARKALEWLVRNHLYMANVTLEPRETLNDMLKHPEIDAFICLRALYYVVSGFLFRWRAIQNIVAFDATLVPDNFSDLRVVDYSEPIKVRWTKLARTISRRMLWMCMKR